MSTLHRSVDGQWYLALKGTPSAVLERCTPTLSPEGSPVVLDDQTHSHADLVNERMARRALRVLGFACSEGPDESNMIWLGLVGIAEPVRPGVPAPLRALHGSTNEQNRRNHAS